MFSTSSSSLDHHSMPEQLPRSWIDDRHFSVNRPIDPNALLFCVWMMSEGFFCPNHPCVSKNEHPCVD
jgi:hypothetical protein